MIFESHNYYLKKLFLEKGINVLTWNYRGYGRSSGTPLPETLKSDMIHVYRYMREKMNLKGKIGVYGRSLGGIPSSFLCKHVDMAIIDRSFSNFSDIAYWNFHGKFADNLFKVVSFGWQAQNDFFAL